MAQSKTTDSPDSDLAKLVAIEDQLVRASEVNRETRQQSVSLSKFAERLAEYKTNEKVTATVAPSDIDSAINTLGAIADVLNPLADLNFTQESLNALIRRVQGHLFLDHFSGQEAIDAAELVSRMSKATSRKSGIAGERRPRGEAETVEGAPERIVVLDSDGEEVTNQAGNRKMTVGNVKSRVMKWIIDNGVTVSDEEAKAITKAIRTAVDNHENQTILDGALTVHVVE